MRKETFSLENEQLKQLLEKYPNKGKNGDIAKITVEVVMHYFLSLNPNTKFKIGGRNQPDITVISNGNSIEYEIKGTEDDDISYDKLKVSSTYCYQKLKEGMEMIRVTSIRKDQVKLYFLKHGEDFTMHEEPRWSVKQIIPVKLP
jgi:hypothetical protein